MKRRAIAAAVLALSVATAALAQTRRPARPPVRVTPSPPAPLSASLDDPFDLRARFGLERATHLLGSPDPRERLRGIERLAAVGSAEAVTLLARELDASSATRNDARAKIAIARGLAARVDQPAARAALGVVVTFATPRSSARSAESEDAEYPARIELARRIAALALAASGDPHAIELLAGLARGSGVGAGAAAAALMAFPPSGGMALWSRPMTPGALRLMDRTGDLRGLEPALDAAKNGDTESRAAAMEALAALGDARVLGLARTGLADEDPRVRSASAAALAQMGAPEAPRAVEELIADDATAARGIGLAETVHGPGVVRALAARAATAADLDVRAAAVASLGRDPTDEGVTALIELARDPALRATAADALARSPASAAMRALERLGGGDGRRLAVHAYVVRALVRREKSGALESLAANLAAAKDPADRATGAFAKVALRESDVGPWLADPDPQVRRAAAIASLASPSPAVRVALLARRGREDDPSTRAVLAAGLAAGDPAGQVPTRALLSCAHAGGGDAPMCAFAFAHRATAGDARNLEPLLASRDPILRAETARGLAGNPEPMWLGVLGAAYPYEVEPLVRRAIVFALGAASHASAPSVAETLSSAAHLDPDAETRGLAARLQGGAPAPSPAPADGDTEVAWVRLLDTAGAPPLPGVTGFLLAADGRAIPVAFDADGDALVPGIPPGPARLVLAPRLGAAYAPSP